VVSAGKRGLGKNEVLHLRSLKEMLHVVVAAVSEVEFLNHIIILMKRD
jgi:hypothetical protein